MAFAHFQGPSSNLTAYERDYQSQATFLTASEDSHPSYPGTICTTSSYGNCNPGYFIDLECSVPQPVLPQLLQSAFPDYNASSFSLPLCQPESAIRTSCDSVSTDWSQHDVWLMLEKQLNYNSLAPSTTSTDGVQTVDMEHALDEYLSSLMATSGQAQGNEHMLDALSRPLTTEIAVEVGDTDTDTHLKIPSQPETHLPGCSPGASRPANHGEEDAFLVVSHPTTIENGGGTLLSQGTRSQAAMTKQLYKSLRLRLFPKVDGPISRVTQLQAAIDRIDALETEVALLRAVVRGDGQPDFNPMACAGSLVTQTATKSKPWIQYAPATN
ncbi:hypothetical protein K488DRAFT_83803 [Vararia minispora EC-137]|uniref:Uncharacterized protein n=1 Tax=Vararia minispora EC-137 TaxID=1314806 RepID=A0ACB8QS35_9AGAM|nr:hypothetical protein K488DRAFT_83803 [Vararia minispora EC-137]